MPSLRKSRNSRKNAKRRTRRIRKARKQHGGRPITFQVVLFSVEEPSEEIKKSIQSLLDEIYGGSTTFEEGVGINKLQFGEVTGLPKNLQSEEATETIFNVAPPVFLQKDSVHYDTRLTALEGQIADKLLEKGLNVSLIPPQHGATDEGISVFAVGLSYPSTFEMTKGMYARHIKRAIEAV
jgi:hypothetical protein